MYLIVSTYIHVDLVHVFCYCHPNQRKATLMNEQYNFPYVYLVLFVKVNFCDIVLLPN